MTQKEMIMDYLSNNKEITPKEAYFNFGIMKLATRVSELIRDGEVIHKKRKKGKNKFGKTVTFEAYSLEPFEDEEDEIDS